MDAYAARQERLAMKEKTTVVTYMGKETKLKSTDLAKIEEGIAVERARTRMLISDNIEMPLLKFVVAEAEGATPALLSMAPEHGTITINGTPVSAETAKGGCQGDAKIGEGQTRQWRLEHRSHTGAQNLRSSIDIPSRQTSVAT
jgi:hypothetical protein